MSIITQTSRGEKSIAVDALCDALCVPRATYYRHQRGDREAHSVVPRKAPKNALSSMEKQRVLDLLRGECFIDKTPYDAFNALIDQGEYYCSPRTMYRVLAEHGESSDRRPQRNHRDAVKPELIATRPNEVWSWDITKLLGPQKWMYYYLYVILDIYSRYVVGWIIADRESQTLASRLIQQTALKQGIQPQQLTLHADRGASMTSHTVAQLLEFLGIAKTHSRPYTSDDNPFSEAQFKTLKYHPSFPTRFASIDPAETFCQRYFNWYNKEHYHSGILWLTPQSVHYGQAKTILERRHDVLMQAYQRNPIRFNNQVPCLKELPEAVYINPPQTVQINSGHPAMILAG
jgi:transposase InsO family protein